jgi:hypothetical protein
MIFVQRIFTWQYITSCLKDLWNASVSIYLYIYICVCVHTSKFLFVSLFFVYWCQPIYVVVHISNYLSVRASIDIILSPISLDMFKVKFILPSVHLSICLLIHPFLWSNIVYLQYKTSYSPFFMEMLKILSYFCSWESESFCNVIQQKFHTVHSILQADGEKYKEQTFCNNLPACVHQYINVKEANTSVCDSQSAKIFSRR